MRVVTWNINSVRLRINSVQKVVKKLNPDILCLLETKCLKEDFPFEDFKRWVLLILRPLA
jgi:Exonuclease III